MQLLMNTGVPQIYRGSISGPPKDKWIYGHQIHEYGGEAVLIVAKQSWDAALSQLDN